MKNSITDATIFNVWRGTYVLKTRYYRYGTNEEKINKSEGRAFIKNS